jgi:hypothetical protein
MPTSGRVARWSPLAGEHARQGATFSIAQRCARERNAQLQRCARTAHCHRGARSCPRRLHQARERLRVDDRRPLNRDDDVAGFETAALGRRAGMHCADERPTTRRVPDRRAEGRRLGPGLEALDDALQPWPVEADHHLTADGCYRHAHLARAAHHLLGCRVVAADVALLIGDTLRTKELLDPATVRSGGRAVDKGPFHNPSPLRHRRARCGARGVPALSAPGSQRLARWSPH